jgi:5-methylcytosine-specific restriction endonuclease McrA
MKKCNKCRVDKPESDFYLDRGVPRGNCKDCVRAGRKRYYKTHRQECIEATRRYFQTPEGAQKRKAWLLARSRTPEFRARVRAWDKTEPGIASRRRRVSRFEKTPAGREATHRKHAKRRAANKSIICTLTAEQWSEILAKHNFACAYCHKPFTSELPATQDHVIPVTKGGHHTAENIVPACRPCNSRKRDRIYAHHP